MYSEPSETYKMKLIILAISLILDSREEIAETFEVILSHSPIYLFIYSFISYSHLLNQAYYCSLEHFCVNLIVHLEIIDRCDRKDLIPSVFLGHRGNSLQGEQKYSKTKVITDVLFMCNLWYALAAFQFSLLQVFFQL